MKLDHLTIDQVRSGLDFVEKSYQKAMDGGAFSLAEKLWDQREALWIELVGRIQSQDPYTTEADIRYFEGVS